MGVTGCGGRVAVRQPARRGLPTQAGLPLSTPKEGPTQPAARSLLDREEKVVKANDRLVALVKKSGSGRRMRQPCSGWHVGGSTLQ